VERLGDNHQDVRQAACNVMLEVLQVRRSGAMRAATREAQAVAGAARWRLSQAAAPAASTPRPAVLTARAPRPRPHSQCHLLRPELTLDRLGRFWAHKNWKVRHGLLQFVAEAVCTLGEDALAARDPEHTRELVRHVVALAEDPERCAGDGRAANGRWAVQMLCKRGLAAGASGTLPSAGCQAPRSRPPRAPIGGRPLPAPRPVRDACSECLEELYRVMGEPLIDLIAAAGLRPALLREIYGRLGNPAAAAAVASPPRSAGGGGKGGSPAAGRRASAGSPGGTGARGSAPVTRARAAAAAAAAAAAPPPAAAISLGVRRGGYKDAGGVGVSGELPPAVPITVASERELRGHLDTAAAGFEEGAGAADWKLRVDSMLILEGLAIGGGAAEYEEAFDEALKALRGTIIEQLLDRRSAVARQACHLLGVLSGALGARFDAFAASVVPVVFKVRAPVWRGRRRLRGPGPGARALRPLNKPRPAAPGAASFVLSLPPPAALPPPPACSCWSSRCRSWQRRPTRARAR
jgi:hypothetical protein